jgi:hypothetical protein
VTIRDEGGEGDGIEHALAMRGEHRVLKLGPVLSRSRLRRESRRIDHSRGNDAH